MAAACAATIVAGSLVGVGVARADAVGLDRFYRQQVDWRACGDEQLDAAGARCADITVPLNYAEPQGRTITVAISRVAATDPGRRHGVLLSNPGGPGVAGLTFTVQAARSLGSGVRERFDLVGMDPRGVGRSTPLHCGWPIASQLRSGGSDLIAYGKNVGTEAELAGRCLMTHGAEIPYITTRNTARDMDVIRGVLGEQRVSYLGGSYGTYLGAVFTQMFPERVDRIVLDSVVDPARYPLGMLQDAGPANEAAFDLWAAWVAARDGEYHMGTTGSAVRAAVTELLRQAARAPIRIGDFAVDEYLLPSLLMDGIVDDQGYPELAQGVRQLADAATGMPVRPNPDLETSLRSGLRAEPMEYSAQSMVFCGDVAAPRNPLWYWRNIEDSRATQPIFGSFVNNISPCAFWLPPVEEPTAVNNSVPALILQATGDPRTVYQGGVALHRALTASRMVTLRDVVTHGVFLKSVCAARIATGYLGDGALPAEDITCEAG